MADASMKSGPEYPNEPRENNSQRGELQALRVCARSYPGRARVGEKN